MLFLSTEDFTKYTVPTITLDSFVKKNKIKSIDLLKVDIEGSEHLMLQGARKTLKKNKIKTILIEICDKKNIYKKKEKKVLNFLRKNNFTLLKKNIYTLEIISGSMQVGEKITIDDISIGEIISITKKFAIAMLKIDTANEVIKNDNVIDLSNATVKIIH